MKITMIILKCLCTTANSFAQPPDAFSYQAVVRNASGMLIINKLEGKQ